MVKLLCKLYGTIIRTHLLIGDNSQSEVNDANAHHTIWCSNLAVVSSNVCCVKQSWGSGHNSYKLCPEPQLCLFHIDTDLVYVKWSKEYKILKYLD